MKNRKGIKTKRRKKQKTDKNTEKQGRQKTLKHVKL